MVNAHFPALSRLGPTRARAAAGVLLATLALTACKDSGTAPAPPPTSPAPVAATPASDRQVNVTWGLTDPTVTVVRLERAGTDGLFTPIATLGNTSTTFADVGLTPATLYRYRLQACNAVGCSDYTNPVSASTFGTLTILAPTVGPAVVGDSIARITLATSGGSAPITFTLASGALPPGVTLTPSGVIAGIPTASGRFPITVRATSVDGQTTTIDLVLVVLGRLQIATTTLPNAVRGVAYGTGLNATGADSVYTWYLDAGSLPAGLSLSNLGIISGTPATEQVSRFNARVRSGDGQTAVREFTITVTAPVSGPALSIRTTLLPPALAGAFYGPALSTGGGNGSLVGWTLVGGSPPPGISLGSGGIFTGASTATGTYTFTVRAQNTAGQSDEKTFTVRVVPDDITRFNITRLDVATVPSNIEPHVQAAIARWENAIRGELADDEIPRGYFSTTFCGGFGEAVNGTAVDDVIIMVNIAPIDGQGKILGQASPCAIRDNVLSLVGTLTLDSDDLQPLAGSQTLTDIIFHEMGHILGFGTLWEADGLHLVTGAGTSDPRFVGTEAVREWNALGGVGTVPLENTGGSGTADSHWRETTFRTELMTGFVSPKGTPNPLSRVTLASFADLGYVVNYGAADAYSLPAGAALQAPPAEPLGWDVVDDTPILMKLPNGSSRPIPR